EVRVIVRFARERTSKSKDTSKPLFSVWPDRKCARDARGRNESDLRSTTPGLPGSGLFRRRKRLLLRIDGLAGNRPQQTVDHHAIVRLQPLKDHAQGTDMLAGGDRPL